MENISLVKDYYEIAGEEFLGAREVIAGYLYCASIKNEHGEKVSTLVEICDGGGKPYAVERDYCLPGNEDDMINSYVGVFDELLTDEESDEWMD